MHTQHQTLAPPAQRGARNSRPISDDAKGIGALIRRRRQAAKLTQAALAAMLDIPYQQLQKYEKGQNRPSPRRLNAISDALGLPPGYFESGAPLAARIAEAEALDRFLERPEALTLFGAIAQLPGRASLDRLIETTLAFCEAEANGEPVLNWRGTLGDAPAVDGEIHALKAELAQIVARRIKARKFTQAAVARALNTDQARISALSRGDVRGISFERLFRFLGMLGLDTAITVKDREG